MPRENFKRGDFVRFEKNTIYGRKPQGTNDVGMVSTVYSFRGGIYVAWPYSSPRGQHSSTVTSPHYKSDLVKAALPDLKEYE